MIMSSSSVGSLYEGLGKVESELEKREKREMNKDLSIRDRNAVSKTYGFSSL
jgi:hypothetical protein